MIIFYYLNNLICPISTHVRVVNSCPSQSPISTDMCVMNFQAHYYWQINHDKIYTHTDQEGILSGIHIVPRQSCTQFISGDN